MALTKPAIKTSDQPPEKRFVIVEGIDNSGKSTLVTHLSDKLLSFSVQRGEGPPKTGENINLRAYKYLQYQGHWLFDRHPIISQPVYGEISTNTQRISPWMMDALLSHKPLIIYCDPGTRGLGEHKARTGEGHIDTPEFLEGLQRNYDSMLRAYREMATLHANHIYRIGDNMDLVVELVNNWLEAF